MSNLKKTQLIGIHLPTDAKNKRSSTSFNKNVWINAAKGSSSELVTDYVKRLENTKNWRWGYMNFVEEIMKIGSDPTDCIKMAKSAWDFVYNKLEVYREINASPETILKAMETPNVSFFETGILKGMNKPNLTLQVPYKGKLLMGQEILDLVSKWQSKGVIEKDTAEVLSEVCNEAPLILESISDKVFVLLGAISEMGPLECLLNWGATVVAIDLNRKSIQKRLFAFAENTPGTLILPLKKGTIGLPSEKWPETSGANLLIDFPEVAHWLTTICPDKQMIIGSFCYLDGEMFIKIVAAMDAICTTVCKKRALPTGLAFYATPTDVHPVTNDSVKAGQKQIQSLFPRFLASLAHPSYTKNQKFGIAENIPYINSIVPRQGPNYILAKRLQTWRAILQRSANHPVSFNVAPTTMTASVMKNKMFAFTMRGNEYYKPLEMFGTGTTKSIMAALLVWDFWSVKSHTNPTKTLTHPLCLLQTTAVHGGMYRTGLNFNDIGLPSFLLAALSKYIWLLFILLLGLKYACF